MEPTIQTDRFYKMDKALQLVEGTTVAAYWAHLVDAYNYFKQNNKIARENMLYQSAKVTQAFTGICTKSQTTARKRLEKLGFLKSKVAAIPGHATKATFFILYPDVYEKWVKEHDYDKLRDEKYKELQPEDEHKKLEEWVKDNMNDAQKQTLKRLGKKQMSLGTIANHTKGHLQTYPRDICKVPEGPVIETIEIETIQSENKQTKKSGCLVSGASFPFLNGITKDELLELIIQKYTDSILENHPDSSAITATFDDRYIGDLDVIEKEFNKLEIEVAANLYIGILGYLANMEDQKFENPTVFKAAYKLENLIKFQKKNVMTKANMKQGEKVAKNIHTLICDPLKTL